MKKILLATGHRSLDEAIVNALNSKKTERYIFDFASFREGIMNKISSFDPDVVVISELIGGSSDILELVLDVKKYYAGIRVVFLTGEDRKDILPILVSHNIYDFIASNEWKLHSIVKLLENPKSFADVQNYLPDISSYKEAFNYTAELKTVQSQDKQPAQKKGTEISYNELTDLTKELNDTRINKETGLSGADRVIFEQGEKIGDFPVLVKTGLPISKSSRPKKANRFQDTKVDFNIDFSEPINIYEKPKNEPRYNEASREPKTTNAQISNDLEFLREYSKGSVKVNLDMEQEEVKEEVVSTPTPQPKEIKEEPKQKTKPIQTEEKPTQCHEEEEEEIDDEEEVVEEESGSCNTTVEPVEETEVPTKEEEAVSEPEPESTPWTEEATAPSMEAETKPEAVKVQEVPVQNTEPEEDVSEEEMFTNSDAKAFVATTSNKSNKKNDKKGNNKTKGNAKTKTTTPAQEPVVKAPYDFNEFKPLYKNYLFLHNIVSGASTGISLAYFLAMKGQKVLYVVHSKYSVIKSICLGFDGVADWADNMERIKFDLPKKTSVQGTVDLYSFSGKRVNEALNGLPFDNYDHVVIELDCGRYENNHLTDVVSKLKKAGETKVYLPINQDYIFLEFLANDRFGKFEGIDYSFTLERFMIDGLSSNRINKQYGKECVKIYDNVVRYGQIYNNKTLFVAKENPADAIAIYRDLLTDISQKKGEEGETE